jgi:hypothetical protein
MAQHVVGFIGEESAQYQSSAGCEDSFQMRREFFQGMTQNIRGDQIETAPD